MTCCFIGHRRVENPTAVFEEVKKVVEALITQKGVRIFHFGSRSAFDDICYAVVTELQKAYPTLVKINYRCKSEYVVQKGERERLESVLRESCGRKVVLNEFEGWRMSDRVRNAGRASYVERNQAMIDESDYCVIYYKEEYQPEIGRKSGTKFAYQYIVRKKKNFINVAR